MSDFAITYRVKGIPENVSRLDFEAALFSHPHLNRSSSLELHSFSTDSSNSSRPRDRTATFSIQPRPSILPAEGSQESQRISLKISGRREIWVYVDADFEGFTPLSPVKRDHSKAIE